MLNYTLGDFLIKFKNAAMAKNKSFKAKPTKLVLAVAECLKKNGYLSSIDSGIFSLAFKNKKPVLMDLKLVSKPGLRIYIDTWELNKRKKPSVLVLSTPKGILLSPEALKISVGGEVIAEIL